MTNLMAINLTKNLKKDKKDYPGLTQICYGNSNSREQGFEFKWVVISKK